MDKERKKLLRRKAGWILLRSCSLIIKVLPLRCALYAGRVFGLLGFRVFLRHRRVALESLDIAFPQKNLEERKYIARKCFEIIGEGGWEVLSFVNHPKHIKERVSIVGKQNLENALKKGKGVIGVSAHLGNFPLMCLRLIEEGFVINTLARPMRDEKTGEFIHKLRTDTGIKTIFSYPRRAAIFGSLGALSNNEVIIIQMDQNFGTGGVWVKFFGKLAATPVGPIVLALRSGAALVPMFIVRNAPGKHTIYIERQVPLEQKDDKDEAILVNAIKFTKIIESWVRKYPQMWSWIHRRWKSRPNPKVYSLKYKVQKD